MNRRDIDFGPGAAAFQRFLKEELMPQVERRTRADSQRRVLVGQSRGGGFVLYSAFTESAQEQRPGPWAMKRIDIEGGTHAADVANAYRAAMSWLFSDAR